MTKVKKKRAARDATPLETIARAIAESDMEPDAGVAKRYGVAAATIRTWRHRAAVEPKLRSLVAAARRMAIEVWRPSAASTLVVLLERLKDAARSGGEIPFSLIAAVKTVGALNVEAGALLGDPNEGSNEGQPEKGAPGH